MSAVSSLVFGNFEANGNRASYLLILTYDRSANASGHITICHFTIALINPVPNISMFSFDPINPLLLRMKSILSRNHLRGSTCRPCLDQPLQPPLRWTRQRLYLALLLHPPIRRSDPVPCPPSHLRFFSACLRGFRITASQVDDLSKNQVRLYHLLWS